MRRGETLTQAEIARAIKAAQATGLVVVELVASKQGVRLITAEGRAAAEPVGNNPWDRFLDDGKAQ